MKYRTLLLTLLTTFAFSSVCAQGMIEDNEDDSPKTFEQLDVNGDGALEESEVLQVQDDHDFEGVEFDTLDEDDDGEVSEEEWNSYFRSN